MERVTVYASDLDSLRLLLTGAGILLGVWWMAQLRAERPDKPKAPTTKAVIYCPLHRIDREDCEHKHTDGA